MVCIDRLWKAQKIKLLIKWKKIAGNIIILQMCTKKHNHMSYRSWEREWDIMFFIWAIFCSFNPLAPSNNPEIQNSEKMKKASGDVIIFNLWTKDTIIWCMLTQIWYATDIIFCHLGPYFALLWHYCPLKSKFWKKM